MWEAMVHCILGYGSAEEVLGVSSGSDGKIRGAWRWNGKVIERVKKRERHILP